MSFSRRLHTSLSVAPNNFKTTITTTTIYVAENSILKEVHSEEELRIYLSVLPCGDGFDSGNTNLCGITSGASANDHCINNGFIYKLEDEACTKLTTGVYIFDSSDGKTAKTLGGTDPGFIYNCGSDSKCTQITSSYYLADSGTKSLYSCANTKICTKVTDAGYYLVDGSLVSIDSTQATSVATPVANAFYLDGSSISGSNYLKLIKCTGTTASTCSSVESPGDGFYLNGDGYVSRFKKLIKYASSSCESVDSPLSTAGHAYIDNSVKNGSDFPNVIYCDKTKCASNVGSTTAAYINAGNPDAGDSTKFPNVIQCTGGKCADAAGQASTTGVGYMDATTTGNIITCDATAGCKSAANGAAKNKNKFYIDGMSGTNGTNFKKVIVCVKDSGCSSLDGTATGSDVDSYYVDSQNADNYISCVKGNGACTSTAHSASTTPAYFVDGYDASKVLKCSSTGCEEKEGATTAGYGYIDAATTGSGYKVITCKSDGTATTCTANDNGSKAASGSVAAITTAFLNAGEDKPNKNIITCATGAICINVALDSTAPAQGHAYLDGTSVDDAGNITNLITCNVSKKECTALAASSKTPSTEDGQVYIDAATANFPNIIHCDGEKCIPMAGSDTSTTCNAYIDATNTANVITCPSNNCVSSANTATAATSTAPANNVFYIDGVTTTNIIACTKANGCSFLVGKKFDDVDTYYADSTIPANIITCKSDETACAKDTHAGTSGDTFYVDGYTGGSSVLKCNGTGGCVSISPANTEEGTAYIESDAKKVIQCTKGPASKRKVTQPTVTEVTTYAALEPVTDTNKYYYIDATDASKIIICDSNGCSNATAPKTNLATAYINPESTAVL
ncbi:hypothetical protein PIROE2DRAFT_2201, partial [Piromyces sp. E2]